MVQNMYTLPTQGGEINVVQNLFSKQHYDRRQKLLKRYTFDQYREIKPTTPGAPSAPVRAFFEKAIISKVTGTLSRPARAEGVFSASS